MDEYILEEGKKFLVSYLKGKSIDYEKLPWRNNWEFIILHSLRVEGYVKKLLNSENHSLLDDEILTIRLAAILHDIGRVHQREDHALISKRIVEDWLRDTPEIANSISDISKLLYLIENHSNKEDGTTDYCLKILWDGDILDEIGVMSIFMASTWIDRNNPYFFKFLSNRVEGFEMDFCDKMEELLNTKTAKLILEEKRKFIELFNNQLKDELYGTEIFGEISIEEYIGG